MSNKKVTVSPERSWRGPEVVAKVPSTTLAPVVVVLVAFAASTPPQLVGMKGNIV